MIESIRNSISRHLVNIPGWRTNRKIVVIESDDWGSIRMPSKEVYEKFLRNGYRVDLNPYERYDSLASAEDLSLLFELLSLYKDKNGNHPVITANCVVANPDFEKIKADNFNNYYYELISDTFKRYPKHKDNLQLWKEGMDNGIFFPQFHAREHLNVSKFMKALRMNDTDVHFGFENYMPGSIFKNNARNGNYFVEATYYDSEKDKRDKLEIYIEGLAIFEEIFGYKSMSIMPPNYTWSNDYNESAAKAGVKFVQGARKMREPVNNSKSLFSNRILGRKNSHGLTDLVRNCSFEPTTSISMNSVAGCLSDISTAFRLKKPAIISSHRINFVGFIDETNRDKNLIGLKKLFSTALCNWPDIEFMTSDNLGMLISESV
jgi:hypothetical protein